MFHAICLTALTITFVSTYFVLRRFLDEQRVMRQARWDREGR